MVDDHGDIGFGGDTGDNPSDIGSAWDMLSAARCVLFDFDGPICRLFPDGSSRKVADKLRVLVADYKLSDVLTEEARTDKDPHVVLRTVYQARGKRDLKDLVERLEELVAEGELDAARKASGESGSDMPESDTPNADTSKSHTPDADRLIELLAGRGARLAVVTNNSAEAADYYLDAMGLRERFAYIHGRTKDPDLMKPDPDVLRRALRSLGLPARDAVMIGDTPTDVEAAARAGVRFIGYGRNAAKRERLRDAGAKVVLESYAPLLELAREVCFAGDGASRGSA